jgi:hypothetical protein
MGLLQECERLLLQGRHEDCSIIMARLVEMCDGECQHTCDPLAAYLEDEEWENYVAELEATGASSV